MGREVAAVVAEEALRGGLDVSRLEESEHHREQCEGGRIVVRARDESEDLDLGLDRGSVVGEHVDEVVLGQEWRSGLRMAGKREAPRAIEAVYALTE